MTLLSRRDMLKTAGVAAAALALPRFARSEAPVTPNMIWIFCDELRTNALGCYGHPHLKLHTPNIDRLAASGVRFTNHFCNSPVCVSSRVATLTGRYPEQTGVYNNEGAWKNFRLPVPLPVAFTQVLARNGIPTANFGKIHVAAPMYPHTTPGYELFQHHNPAGGEMGFFGKLGEQKVQMIRSPNGGMQGGIFPDDVPYPPDQVVNNGLAWMAEQKGPFFARLSILQPHTPVMPPAAFYKLYEDQDPGLPPPLPATLSAFERRTAEIHQADKMDRELLRKARRCYYAQVAWVDFQVGKVLQFLEKKGLIEKTLIVFGADHGTPGGDTGAFEKHTFAPCVHRVPFIVSRPGVLKGGQVRTDICDSLDLGRTVLAAAGLAAPESFMGRDLFSAPAPEAVYSTIGFGEPGCKLAPNGGRGDWLGGRGWPRRSCVRTARFRLDKNMRIDGQKAAPEDEDLFLADMLADPDETVNLAGKPECAAEVKRLSALLDAHAANAVTVPLECIRR